MRVAGVRAEERPVASASVPDAARPRAIRALKAHGWVDHKEQASHVLDRFERFDTSWDVAAVHNFAPTTAFSEILFARSSAASPRTKKRAVAKGARIDVKLV